MNSRTQKDFMLAFEMGATFDCINPSGLDKTIVTARLSTIDIGKLALPSGKIIACDALGSTDGYNPFSTNVPPGSYPVTLSVANFDFVDSRGSKYCDSRVAYAMVRFKEHTPVQWKMALRDGEDDCGLSGGEVFGYGVDSGTGCFMDGRAGEFFAQLEELDAQILNDWIEQTGVVIEDPAMSFEWLERTYSEQLAEPGEERAPKDELPIRLKAFDPDIYEMWVNANQILLDWDNEPQPQSEAIFNQMNLQFEKNQQKTWAWANYILEEPIGINIVAFSSGWGDGGYASYFGMDNLGNPVCLVTDFGVER
jgi:hypothetical protein